MKSNSVSWLVEILICKTNILWSIACSAQLIFFILFFASHEFRFAWMLQCIRKRLTIQQTKTIKKCVSRIIRDPVNMTSSWHLPFHCFSQFLFVLCTPIWMFRLYDCIRKCWHTHTVKYRCVHEQWQIHKTQNMNWAKHLTWNILQ